MPYVNLLCTIFSKTETNFIINGFTPSGCLRYVFVQRLSPLTMFNSKFVIHVQTIRSNEIYLNTMYVVYILYMWFEYFLLSFEQIQENNDL